MRAELKHMHLEQFKGATDKDIDFSPLTVISGKNGEGKTTIADGYFWTFKDRDYSLASNPDVKPTLAEGTEQNGEEKRHEPRVELTLDVDGKEVTVTKYQKINKAGNVSNKYEINNVPKTNADMVTYLREIGLDVEKVLSCCHPTVFLIGKPAEIREELFKLSKGHTDLEVAMSDEKLSGLVELLEKYTSEEIIATQKATVKRANEQIKAIPIRINEQEKSKVDIDFAELELQKKILEEKIADLDKKISTGKVDISDLQKRDMDIQFEMSGMRQNANLELDEQKRQYNSEKYEIQRAIERLKDELSKLDNVIERETRNIELSKKEREKLGIKYKEENARVFDDSAWVFDDSTIVCSLCGQKLPEDKIETLKLTFEAKKEKARQDFNNRKREITDKLIVQGNEYKENEKHYNSLIEESVKEKDAKTAELASVTARMEELNKTVFQEAVDITKDEKFIALQNELDSVRRQIEKMKAADMTETYLRERSEVSIELDGINLKLADANNNIRIDERIAELQEEAKKYEQVKADGERILELCSLLSQRKNTLCSDEINSYFNVVRWKLFDYQKNGEYKEVCVPTILDNGIWKEYGKSMNTGLMFKARLDICNAFQKFYDMHLPIFLDNAESINEWNIPEVDTQLIIMKVTEESFKVEGV